MNKNIDITKRSKGFTLAEVLITLTIVGVIASMTIPSLINSTNKQELGVQLKAAYSILNQGVQQMVTSEGSGLVFRYSSTFAVHPDYYFKDDFLKYFNIAKDCDASDCINDSFGYIDSLGGNGVDCSYYVEGQFNLTNGMTVGMSYIPSDGEVAPYYILLAVDVNGSTKEPNILGYDLFEFFIDENDTLRPRNVNEIALFGVDMVTDPTCNDGGRGCATLALTDPEYFNNLP